MKLIIPFFDRIPFLDKYFFAKHLSLMIKAGLTLHESVAIIQEQSRSKKFKKILDNVLKNIESGRSLAISLSRHPRVFDKFYINIIKVGEESGTLGENLEYLALQLEKSNELRNKVKAAMIYPLIILSALILLTIGVIFFVLPKIIPLFKTLVIELPLATKVLIRFTEITQSYGFYVLIGVIVSGVILFLLFRTRLIKTLIHRTILKIPLVGSILRNFYLSYFGRTLGILLKSGLPLIRALDVTQVTLGNLTYQKELEQVTEEVKKGRSISDYLGERRAVFPLIVSRMVGAGEKTGSLEETLLYLGNFYEAEVDRATKNLSSVIEPIILVIVGAGVAFIALAIISPIYELTRALQP